MSTLPGIGNLRAKARIFLQAESVHDLAGIADVKIHQLNKLAGAPAYNVFTIPKKKGTLRTIEDPHPPLKEALRKINEHLQCIYFFNCTPAAYGFVISHKRNTDERNILTNAAAHLGKEYLLNIDLKDFFHQVTWRMVYDIFTGKPFYFNDEMAKALASLTTFNGRLPMGSPTSPVLSNFAAITLDAHLLQLSKKNITCYTRFVDDLSFSSHNDIISDAVLAEILNAIKSCGFEVNPLKIKKAGRHDLKEVTGLQLNNTVEIKPVFFTELEQDLLRLKSFNEVAAVNNLHEKDRYEKFHRHIDGKLNFILMIYGKGHHHYRRFSKLYAETFDNTSFIESFSWRDLPYGF